MKSLTSAKAFQNGIAHMTLLATLVLSSNAALANSPVSFETMKADCQMDYIRQESAGRGYGSAIEELVGSNTIPSNERVLQIEVDKLTARAHDLIFNACAKVRLSKALQK